MTFTKLKQQRRGILSTIKILINIENAEKAYEVMFKKLQQLSLSNFSETPQHPHINSPKPKVKIDKGLLKLDKVLNAFKTKNDKTGNVRTHRELQQIRREQNIRELSDSTNPRFVCSEEK